MFFYVGYRGSFGVSGFQIAQHPGTFWKGAVLVFFSFMFDAQGQGLPSGKHTKSCWKYHIEIVALLINSMVIFHSHVNVYQAGYLRMLDPIKTSMVYHGWSKNADPLHKTHLVGEPYPSEKYEFVSWGDEIPNIWKIKAMFQTTNQSYS